MSEREAFIAAIAAEPEDDTRRLAFIDWLEEHDETTRAEFLRTIHELAGRLTPQMDPSALPPDLQKLEARILNLFTTHGAGWLDPLCHALGTGRPRPAPRGRWATRLLNRLTGKPRKPAYTIQNFRCGYGLIEEWDDGPVKNLGVARGFVSRARLRLESPLPVRDIGAALQLEPIHRLWLDVAHNPDQWRRVNIPALAQIADLTVEVPSEADPNSVGALDTVLHGGQWSGVREFSLWRDFSGFEPAPPEYVTLLAESPLLDGLRSLGIKVEQPDLRPLTANPHLATLGAFAAWGCSMPDAAAEALAGATFRPTLEKLELALNSFGEAGAGRLAGVTWPKLRELDLGCNEIGDAGVRALLPLVPQLTDLSLATCGITDVGARELAAALDPDRLKSLWLSYNPLSPETVATLRARFGDRFHFTTRDEDGLPP